MKAKEIIKQAFMVYIAPRGSTTEEKVFTGGTSALGSLAGLPIGAAPGVGLGALAAGKVRNPKLQIPLLAAAVPLAIGGGLAGLVGGAHVGSAAGSKLYRRALKKMSPEERARVLNNPLGKSPYNGSHNRQ